MEFAKRLKQIMHEKDMRACDLATKTGISKGSISQYLSGTIEPRADKLYLLAKALGVEEAYLMGYDIPPKNYRLYPIVEVHAGYNGIELEPTEDKESIPLDWIKGDSPDSFIVYKVKGQSMYPMMEEGDRLLVHRQSSVNSGEIAVIVLAEMSSVKRVIYNPDLPTYLRLEAINPTFPPMVIEGEADVSQTFIIGKVVRQIRTF